MSHNPFFVSADVYKAVGKPWRCDCFRPPTLSVICSSTVLYCTVLYCAVCRSHLSEPDSEEQTVLVEQALADPPA